jgi:hypothetical protein
MRHIRVFDVITNALYFVSSYVHLYIRAMPLVIY